MLVRTKTSGIYQYLQVVQNERIDGQVRQQVVATLGRLDVLQAQGQLDGLVSSCARFAQKVSVLDAYQRQALAAAEMVKIGPPLVFGRLWQELGLPAILEELLAGRRYEFAMERAIFLTVLHRLMGSGSDRAAEQWCRDYALDGVQELQLHHRYRAMAWLGEELAADQQIGGHGVRPSLHQGPDRSVAVRSSSDAVGRSGSGVLRYDERVLRRPGRPDDRTARPPQRSPAGPPADGRGGRDRQHRPADLL
ncbi:MAG: hypothetical protein NTZ17_13985 [Phycisphaerae bacterium]|nr:hypothetical protein [Phycisphaerae bacterium]